MFFLKQRLFFFLMFLKQQTFISHDSGSWEEPSSWFIGGAFLLYPHVAERALVFSSSYNGTYSIMGAS